MEIRLKDLEKLNEKGVYALYNKRKNRVYIGSTNKSFAYRLGIHESRLKANNHENIYLQRSWNKYKNFFEFRILMITEDNFDWEQRFIDFYKPFGKRGYNMNKNASCPPTNLSKKVIIKRTNTFKQTVKEALKYYNKVKSNEILLEDVPEKYSKLVNYYLIRTVWNKGIKGYKNPNYPKNRILSKEGALKRKDAFKHYRKSVNVYKDGTLLGEYSSPKEVSLDSDLHKYVSLYKSKKGVNLMIPNICSACRTGKPYKGLIFKYNQCPSK